MGEGIATVTLKVTMTASITKLGAITDTEKHDALAYLMTRRITQALGDMAPSLLRVEEEK